MVAEMGASHRYKSITNAPIDSDRADALSRLEQHSLLPILSSDSELEPYAQPLDTSSYYTAPADPWLSNVTSHRPCSYYSANSSPSYLTTTNSASTLSSNISFPFSVTSINSYKSRKNVLYPRRVHPLPVAVSSEPFIFPEALVWQVRFLCKTLLPHTETRLVPAGRVILQSLGPHGDSSQRVPVRTDEETRCCAELFIAVTREVLLKGAVGVRELEEPCKLLHLTFVDILIKSGGFDTPMASNLNETGIFRAARAETRGPERFSNVLRTLSSVMSAFETALDMINPLAVSEEALREHHHQVSQKFLTVKDLTIDKYRNMLGQRLAQVHPLHSEKISTIEEVSGAVDEWDIVDSNNQSCSNKRSFARRFLCRFPSLSWALAKKKDKK